MEENVWTIDLLAQISGVSVRNIRYYQAEGLLPTAVQQGKYVLYGETHLRRLRCIQRLKEAFFPLSAIKNQLEQLSEEQIRELSDGETASVPALQNSRVETESVETGTNAQPMQEGVAAYIARVRAQQAQRAQSGTPVPRDAVPSPALVLPVPPAAPPASAATSSWPAPTYPPATETVPSSAPPASAAAPVASFEAPVVPTLSEETARAERSAPASAPFPLSRNKTSETATETTNPGLPERETWEHVRLIAGVELHYRVPVQPGAREFLDRLLNIAQSLRLIVPDREKE